MYTEVNIKTKSVVKSNIEQPKVLTVVNGLNINLNCAIEIDGNHITVWIKSEKE